MRRSQYEMPTSDNGVGGIRLGGLGQRMRDRWRAVSSLWEANKAAANKIDLVGQLDYYGKLSSQLAWRQNSSGRLIRVVYSGSGTPTAALLPDEGLVDYTLYWTVCNDLREAHYLLAIINSDALYAAVTPLMAKGQFGARHLQKHLWKLPIPEFDPGNLLHITVSEAGEVAAGGVAKQLAQLRQDRGEVTVTIARRELRKWLRESTEGKAVEEAVGELLSKKEGAHDSA